MEIIGPIIENSMEVLQNIKISHISSNSTTGQISKGIEVVG
jgi:hypothetical protein